MVRQLISLVFLAACSGGLWAQCGALPFTLANGTPADANQVMANFEHLRGCAGFGFRNRIINGDMRIDQRNQGLSQSIPTTGTYTVDRFFASASGASVTGSRVAGTGADEFAYQFTGATSNTGITFGQRIESTNIYDVAGSTATFSVLLSNSTPMAVTWRAYYANSPDSFGTKTQMASGTFAVTATPTRFIAPVPMALNSRNGVAMELSVASQTSGTWAISDFQLEPGIVPTAFERRSYAVELVLCQRYLPAYLPGNTASYFGTGVAGGTTYAFIVVPFRVRARTAPTSAAFSSVATTFYVRSVTVGLTYLSDMAFYGATTESAELLVIVPTGLTLGHGVNFGKTSAGLLLFNGAEL